MIRKNDLILVAAFIIICLTVFLCMNALKKDGSKLVITVDGKVYDTLDLNKDTTYTVKLSKNAYDTFVIKNGQVDMTEASCPDKLCVTQKKIHYEHETIVCLPNKVVLEVVNGDKNDVDMIAR